MIQTQLKLRMCKTQEKTAESWLPAVSGVGGVRTVGQTMKPELYLYGPVQSFYGRTAHRSLIGENTSLFESIGTLQRELKRLRNLEVGWDGESAEVIASETLASAHEVLGQISDAMFSVAEQVSVPSISPYADGRICFSWKRGDKELWIYLQNGIADVYRWEPLQRRESESFEGMTISEVREHIAWIL